MWALIIVVYWGFGYQHGVLTSTSLNGFKSKALCDKAQQEVKRELSSNGYRDEGTVVMCVQQSTEK